MKIWACCVSEPVSQLQTSTRGPSFQLHKGRDRASAVEAFQLQAAAATGHLLLEPGRERRLHELSLKSGPCVSAAGPARPPRTSSRRPADTRTCGAQRLTLNGGSDLQKELRRWLESSGGLSADCLDSLEAARVDGDLPPGWIQRRRIATWTAELGPGSLPLATATGGTRSWVSRRRSLPCACSAVNERHPVLVEVDVARLQELQRIFQEVVRQRDD